MRPTLPTEHDVDVDDILDLAEDALDRGDPQSALRYCGQVLAHDPEHSGANFLCAEAYRDLHDLDEAERRFRMALTREPEHGPTWSGLAGVLFDDLRFDEAERAACRAIRLDPEGAEGWWWRGLLRERRGDLRGADRDLHRASLLDPLSFPWAVSLSDAMVEAIVTSAVRTMHPSIQAYLSQVSILLEEIPDLDVVESFEPPLPPNEILGFFSGYSLDHRSTTDPWSHLPSAIVLFRRNLERFAADRETLLEELRVTVLHEVGHYLGLDEDDLEARGLD